MGVGMLRVEGLALGSGGFWGYASWVLIGVQGFRVEGFGV